jgi:hypothetical protein
VPHTEHSTLPGLAIRPAGQLRHLTLSLAAWNVFSSHNTHPVLFPDIGASRYSFFPGLHEIQDAWPVLLVTKPAGHSIHPFSFSSPLFASIPEN